MLTGKTAIVTGANRGIGLATVEVFAEQGAAVWACARMQTDEFEEKIKEISSKYAATVTPVYFDVTKEAEVKDAVKMISGRSKTIDILVNNAGISVERLFSMTSIETINNTMEVNFLSQVRLAQFVSRLMVRNKAGSIINIASVSGMESEQGSIAYGSSKAAVIFSTKTMAVELGKCGIRVNSVSPGFIDTDMWKNRDDDVRDRIIARTPLGRQGTPKEVANVILFLASDMASYMTGQNLVVDGGRFGWGGVKQT